MTDIPDTNTLSTDLVDRARAWGDSPRRSLIEIQDIALQLADEIERLRAQLAWQPIETFDKTKTDIDKILVYGKSGDMGLVEWHEEGTSWNEDCSALVKTGVWMTETGWFEPNEVTHFKLIGPPPEDT